MGIRQTLNQRPTITTGAVAILLAVLGIIMWRTIGGGPAGQSGSKAFFTVDDGNTWFTDDIRKVAPFDKDGKPAYQCFVWTCDGGKTKFVSHLHRYTPEAKKRLEEAQAKGSKPDAASVKIIMTGVEVKSPGSGDDPKYWINDRDPRAGRIMQPVCKEGNRENLQPVMP